MSLKTKRKIFQEEKRAWFNQVEYCQELKSDEVSKNLVMAAWGTLVILTYLLRVGVNGNQVEILWSIGLLEVSGVPAIENSTEGI